MTVSAATACAARCCSVCTRAPDTKKLSSSPWWQLEWQDTWARMQWKIASLLQSPPARLHLQHIVFPCVRTCVRACDVFDGSCSGILVCVLSEPVSNLCRQQGEKGWCRARLKLRLNAERAELVCVCVCVCKKRENGSFSSEAHNLTQPIRFSPPVQMQVTVGSSFSPPPLWCLTNSPSQARPDKNSRF